MSNIIIFTHEMFGEIRVTDNNGEPWFIAKDIAERLDYDQASSLLKIIEDEDKNSIISTLNPNSVCPQKVSIINESGLYQAIMRSTKPEAKQFKRWVCKEVLPAIRKTGSYSVQPQLPDFNNPIAAARAWADECEAKQLALKQAEYQNKALTTSQTRNATLTREKKKLEANLRGYQEFVSLSVYLSTEKISRYARNYGNIGISPIVCHLKRKGEESVDWFKQMNSKGSYPVTTFRVEFLDNNRKFIESEILERLRIIDNISVDSNYKCNDIFDILD